RRWRCDGGIDSIAESGAGSGGGKVRRSLVVAVSDNGVIGVRNALPWRLPSELRRFKRLTMKRPIVMGRRTHESIGRALPGRDNIVVTEGSVIDNPDVHTVNSVEEAMALAERLARSRRASEVMIIGGAQIFEQTRPLADRVYLTRVHKEVEGDTFWTDLDPARWQEVKRRRHKAEDGDETDYTMLVYDRIPAK
ncbi:MAG: dihydrofolate reductase, partial [Hyphomicrobiales bacterium]